MRRGETSPQLAGTEQLLSVEDLRLMTPKGDLLPQLVKARRVLQYIDGVVYDWDEFELPRRGAEPLLAIQLRSPFAKLLDLAKAQVLLSASRRVAVELPPAGTRTLDRLDAILAADPIEAPPGPARPVAVDRRAAGDRPDAEIASPGR
jgi:hypothetical protein